VAPFDDGEPEIWMGALAADGGEWTMYDTEQEARDDVLRRARAAIADETRPRGAQDGGTEQMAAEGVPGAPARTEHVYEGGADARQSMDPEMKPSRFRTRYRPLTPEEVVLHDAIKMTAASLEGLIGDVPQGRMSALALTKLEECVFWAVKALTA